MMRLDIPLRPELLGIDQFDHGVMDRVTRSLTERNGHVKLMIAAVLDTHQSNRDDVVHLRDKFAKMTVGTKREGTNFLLSLEQVPNGVTFDGKQLTRSQQDLITEVIRDTILTPDLSPRATPEEITAFTHDMAKRAGILDLDSGDSRVRTFIWGGHTIPPDEYAFAKEVGYWDGLRGMELITGSGAGVMRAPFVGASSGYRKQRLNDRKFIGFTEQGILAGEAPNTLLSTLCVFPDIEKRMEAFIRASHRGRVHPGGTGTMEEITTFLGMKMHPKNEGLSYPFDLVERPNGEYMKRLQEFFRICFSDALDGLMDFRVETPQDYHRHVDATNQGLDTTRLWNHELYIPPEIQKPFEVTFDSMEALDLSREQDPFQLVVNLRRFFSGMVYLVVKNPKMVDSWGKDRPKIKGDKKIIREVDELVRWFNDQKRLKMELKLTQLPYRIE
ncbi:MAG: pyrimidine/purine nucleotide monophosphate nucleosidase domain-containing protein [Candidatus Altimarinota bacterium]